MWRFRKIEPGVVERNPRESEFFRLTEPDEAVVREFIQNALDARYEQETVRVRIYIGRARGREISTYLNELSPHLSASGFNRVGDSEIIEFLTIEDSGTTGLDGDTGRSDSNFYHFWWREGISAKTGRRAGRWGLGKITFHLVSKIRTFWGFTVRKDDSRALLMGKALLKPHQVNSDIFDYAGYYCDENWQPVEEPKARRRRPR